MNKILIKINKPFDQYKCGEQIIVKCDIKNIPLNLDWRRRLKDAENDFCCEIIKPVTKRKSKQLED